MRESPAYYLRAMRLEDIPQVAEIELEAFSTQWTPTSFRRELDNRMARYLVVVRKSATQSFSHALPDHRPPRTFWGRMVQTVRTILFPDETAFPPAREFVAGYVGIWFMVEEAHIISIAVLTASRGHGRGELLLLGAIETAMIRRSRVVTLEVRETNVVAQSLYGKYGFKRCGIRKGYYTDNNESAVIMTTDPINTPNYQEQFQQLITIFSSRHGEPVRTLA